MEIKNKIEKKIYALLQKTEENGATKEEARTQTTALVLVEKENQVDNFYKDETEGQRLGTRRTARPNNAGGYFEGKKRGAKLSLTHGIG